MWEMRFGVSSYAFAWSIGVPGYPVGVPMSALDLLDEAGRLGADAVQFADNLPLHRLSGDQRARLKERAIELDLGIEVGARGLTRERLGEYIRIAREMASPILRFVIDQQGHEPDMGWIESLIRESLNNLEENRLRLALENHDRFRVAEYVSLLEALGSDRVGICLDTVNSLGAGQGYETVVETLGPYTINLHVKDFIIRRVPHQMGFEVAGAPAGEGMLPIPELLAKLEFLGQCQTAVLETWPPLETSLEATISKERKWAQASANFLKGALERTLLKQDL